MNRGLWTPGGGVILAFGLAIAGTPALSAPQDNRCWGESASALAQFDSPHITDEKGGGMGLHSRSARAGANVGGGAFVSQPRDGVGNVSQNFIHDTHPGQGGNGQHGVNNSQVFAAIADPALGFGFPGIEGGLLGEDGCSTGLEPNFP